MKRTDPCPECDGTGRRAILVAVPESKDPETGEVTPATEKQIVATSEAWTDPASGVEYPAFEGDPQCDRCAGTGKISNAPAAVAKITVRADHPRAKEIAALLEEGK